MDAAERNGLAGSGRCKKRACWVGATSPAGRFLAGTVGAMQEKGLLGRGGARNGLAGSGRCKKRACWVGVVQETGLLGRGHSPAGRFLAGAISVVQEKGLLDSVRAHPPPQSTESAPPKTRLRSWPRRTAADSVAIPTTARRGERSELAPTARDPANASRVSTVGPKAEGRTRASRRHALPRTSLTAGRAGGQRGPGRVPQLAAATRGAPQPRACKRPPVLLRAQFCRRMDDQSRGPPYLLRAQFCTATV